MEFHIFTNPQQGGSTHEDVVLIAKAAESLGLDGFFRSDHYRALGEKDGIPGSGDAWVTLGALAAETHRIRLGTLMTAATFRHPGVLATIVAQVDRISHGRVDFGFGVGYYEPEHQAYGIPFYGLAERFDRFEEQLEVITGLWGTAEGSTFTHKGKFYQLTESPALPKPSQRPRPPIMIGGRGKKKTPRLAARYADEYNFDFPALEAIPPQTALVNRACEKIGRNPSTIRLSAAVMLACGRSDAEVARRTEVEYDTYYPESLEHGLVGSPGQVVDRIGKFADAGISRIYLQTPQQFDLDHWEFFVDQVLPQLT